MSTQEIDKLKRQIEELISENKKLNSKLEESELMKTHFISNVMNEIYNPFASIISMAENIKTLNKNNLHKANNMAKIIVDEAQKLDFHLKNLFAAARLEAGIENLEFSNIDLSQIVRPILQKLKNEIDIRDLKINYTYDFGDNTFFHTDKNKLVLIIENLLNNAVKFSSDNGTVVISIIKSVDFIKIHISNTLAEDLNIDVEEVFDRFKRGDFTINSVRGGNGLGLSIVKEYIELMEGEVSIEQDRTININISIPEKAKNTNTEDDILTEEEFF
jgi:signal transduction histidine kinase